MTLLTHTQLVVDRRNVKGGLKHTQVGQSSHVGDAQVGSHHCLEIYSDQRHEILHATGLLCLVGSVPT